MDFKNDGCVSPLREQSTSALINIPEPGQHPRADLKFFIEFAGERGFGDDAQLELIHMNQHGESVSALCVTEVFKLAARNSESRDLPNRRGKRVLEDDSGVCHLVADVPPLELSPLELLPLDAKLWYRPGGVLCLEGVKNFRRGKVSAGKSASMMQLELYFDNISVSEGDYVIATLCKVGECGTRHLFPGGQLVKKRSKAVTPVKKARVSTTAYGVECTEAALTEIMKRASENGVDVHRAYSAFVVAASVAPSHID